MGRIFSEILNLCEVRKFCDDPASRSANWDQVNQLFYQFQRNLSNSKISLKLIEYFVYLVPVCGPGSWVIAKFSYFTQIEDFRKNSTHGEYIDKIQEASHGWIFTFLFHLDKNGEKEIGMTRGTVLYIFVCSTDHTSIWLHHPVRTLLYGLQA